jgi:hypothetical protein
VSTKSRESIYGSSIRASAERAAEARKQADRLACEAWNQRMLGYKGPAQPSPTLGDALNAGYRYLEVRCLGCDTHQTVALDSAQAEDDAYPRAGALHAMQGLFAGPRLPDLAPVDERVPTDSVGITPSKFSQLHRRKPSHAMRRPSGLWKACVR